jgi:hypothetical protein
MEEYGMQESQEWIIEETKSANFGDQRLNKRYSTLLDSFASSPNKSIPSSCKSWAETLAAYRFMNHDDVTVAQILAPHKEATLNRIKKEKIVLIPQDTTDIDFTGRKSISGMGYLSKEYSLGFYLHASIAITPERCCLGVLDLQTWMRDTFGTRRERRNSPIEEKETYCWIKGYEAANEIALAASDTVIISVSDRESDIYDLLEKLPSEENKAYWLVRAKNNRYVLNEETQKFESKLWETIKTQEPVGEIEFKMLSGTSNRNSKKRHTRKERIVKQKIKTARFSLKSPCNKISGSPCVAVNVVHCEEINPPVGEEKIEWLLLTSFPISTTEAAMQVVQWYLCRWQIETFFKILKSGCKIEELQFDTLKGTANCVALYTIVSWRILYLTMLGRHCPDLDCSIVFEKSEWQSVYAIVNKKSPPKKPPSLNEIILIIGKLGGFLGRKCDGYPGPRAMWIGMQRMKDFTLAWEAFCSIENKSYV